MKAACLFAVLIWAKILTLPGREVSLSWWSLIALTWQDFVVVLLFAAIDAVIRRPAVSWILYAATVLYTAINLPLERLLSTPLTWNMLRAARSTLADSIAHHFTWTNIGLIALVLAAGAAMPLFFKKFSLRLAWLVSAIAIITIALGPAATVRIESSGLHRNAVVTLFSSALPRISAKSISKDWRTSPFENAPIEDLTRFRGIASGRNVILLMLESTGAQYLGLYGAAVDSMPNLTSLANDALVIENAYATYPESIKGLFSVLCSRYPAIETTPEAYKGIGLPSIAQVLRDSGYRTALFHSGRFMYLGMDSMIENRGYEILEDAGHIGGNQSSSFGVDEPATVERILAWIDRLPKSEKFFVTYLPIAGHHPYDSPDPRPFPQKDEVDRYRNALHYGDAALGEFLAGLKSRGLFGNTLFVVMGDHGEAFEQHEGNNGHTLFIYEENLRVPYLVAAPGAFGRQIRVRPTVSLVDTAPTILDLIGAASPPRFEGESLLKGRHQMALFYTDYSLGLLGLRDGRWKYIYDIDSTRSKLFDLESDPAERKNFATDFPDRVQFYRHHLLQWSAAQKYNVLSMKQPGRDDAAQTRNSRVATVAP
jgi:phosphoglycerol transferase MdoB-like AlkP superfamily enzyme